MIFNKTNKTFIITKDTTIKTDGSINGTIINSNTKQQYTNKFVTITSENKKILATTFTSNKKTYTLKSMKIANGNIYKIITDSDGITYKGSSISIDSKGNITNVRTIIDNIKGITYEGDSISIDSKGNITNVQTIVDKRIKYIGDPILIDSKGNITNIKKIIINNNTTYEGSSISIDSNKNFIGIQTVKINGLVKIDDQRIFVGTDKIFTVCQNTAVNINGDINGTIKDSNDNTTYTGKNIIINPNSSIVGIEKIETSHNNTYTGKNIIINPNGNIVGIEKFREKSIDRNGKKTLIKLKNLNSNKIPIKYINSSNDNISNDNIYIGKTLNIIKDTVLTGVRKIRTKNNQSYFPYNKEEMFIDIENNIILPYDSNNMISDDKLILNNFTLYASIKDYNGIIYKGKQLKITENGLEGVEEIKKGDSTYSTSTLDNTIINNDGSINGTIKDSNGITYKGEQLKITENGLKGVKEIKMITVYNDITYKGEQLKITENGIEGVEEIIINGKICFSLNNEPFTVDKHGIISTNQLKDSNDITYKGEQLKITENGLEGVEKIEKDGNANNNNNITSINLNGIKYTCNNGVEIVDNDIINVLESTYIHNLSYQGNDYIVESNTVIDDIQKKMNANRNTVVEHKAYIYNVDKNTFYTIERVTGFFSKKYAVVDNKGNNVYVEMPRYFGINAIDEDSVNITSEQKQLLYRLIVFKAQIQILEKLNDRINKINRRQIIINRENNDNIVQRKNDTLNLNKNNLNDNYDNNLQNDKKTIQNRANTITSWMEKIKNRQDRQRQNNINIR